MLKKIFFELVAIRKELQAIRSCLESRKVSMDVNVNASRDVAFQSMSKEDIEAYRNISEKLYGCHMQGREESNDIDVNQLADRLANRLNLSSGSSSRIPEE